jgi:NADPH:quinone reductase-like Zn-dependent oxidoreductase
MAIPKSLEASDVAALMAGYLPAYEALHFGRTRPLRYSGTSLQGKRILVVSGAAATILQALAIVRLATLAGARDITMTTAPNGRSSILKRQKHCATILHDNPDEWLPVVQGKMDVVVDYTFPQNLSAVTRALAKDGRLICCPQSKRAVSSADCKSVLDLDSFLLERYQLSMVKNAYLFDYPEYVRQFRSQVVEDARFLLHLLARRKLRPQIDRFITFKDVQLLVHREFQTGHRFQGGAVICEPWKE